MFTELNVELWGTWVVIYSSYCGNLGVKSNMLAVLKTKTKLRGLSPRANYTDKAAAAGRRS